MSEGAAEGGGDAGAPLSGDQFTGVNDVPTPGTVQNPGTGIFAMGYAAWGRSFNDTIRPPARHRRKRKHRR
jgi:hypothetical protein